MHKGDQGAYHNTERQFHVQLRDTSDVTEVSDLEIHGKSPSKSDEGLLVLVFVYRVIFIADKYQYIEGQRFDYIVTS